MKKKTIKQFISSELSGSYTKILEHSDPGLVGIEGIIVSETRNMLKINTGDTEMMVSKENGVFSFELEGSNINVNGNLLIGDAKSRGKKKYRAW